MNIAVLGANGRSGKCFVDAAVAAGHTVRAGVHHAMPTASNEQVTYLTCDATNEQQVVELLRNTDAVVSLIGHVKDSAPNVQTVAIQNVVIAMNKLGIKRLVSLTGTGVRLPGDVITLTDRFLNLGVGIVDPHRVTDGIKHAEIIKESGLDWTIVRVLKLQNIKSGTFMLTEHGPTKPIVSRQEVALALLQVLQDGSFVGKMPILSRI